MKYDVHLHQYDRPDQWTEVEGGDRMHAARKYLLDRWAHMQPSDATGEFEISVRLSALDEPVTYTAVLEMIPDVSFPLDKQRPKKSA